MGMLKYKSHNWLKPKHPG